MELHSKQNFNSRTACSYFNFMVTNKSNWGVIQQIAIIDLNCIVVISIDHFILFINSL